MADMGELLKIKQELENKLIYNPSNSSLRSQLREIEEEIEARKKEELFKRVRKIEEPEVEEAEFEELPKKSPAIRRKSTPTHVERNVSNPYTASVSEQGNPPREKWKKTKKVWGTTKKAAGHTGNFFKWGGNKLKSGGQKAWSGAKTGKEKWSNGSSSRKLDLIYFIILLTHFFDAYLQFSWEAIAERLILYTVMVVLICFLLGRFWTQNAIPMIIISLFMIFGYPGIKYVLTLVNISQDTATLVITIMTIFPIMALYFRMIGLTYEFDADGDGWIMATIKAIFFFRVTHWLKIWMTFWTVAAIIILIGGLGESAANLPGPPNTIDATPKEIVDKTVEIGKTAVNKVVESFVTLFSIGKNTYTSYMNTTLGKYYSGRVEENKKDTGVFIDNFRASGNYQEGTEIAFSPIIKTRSFAGDIDLIFNCTAFDTRNKSNVVNGYLNYDKLTLSEDDTRSVICRFNHGDENDEKNTYLTKGSYRVEFTAEFDFETWAYADYIFMEKDLLQSIRISGDDVNKKFGIPKEPTVVYTSGPAKVGMKEQILDGMPFGLSYDGDSFILVGMTLDNPNKLNGEILNVNNFQLRIPKIFTTTDKFCTRKMTRKSPYDDSNSEKYHIYEFEKPPGINLKQTYLTVDCQLTINNNDAYGLLGGSGGMAQTSMVATANYTYLLKSRTSIKVEENPFLQNE